MIQTRQSIHLLKFDTVFLVGFLLGRQLLYFFSHISFVFLPTIHYLGKRLKVKQNRKQGFKLLLMESSVR